MRPRSLIALAALTTVSVTTSSAAQREIGGIAYSVAIPLGDTKNYVDNFSWVGATLEGRWFTKPNVSLGFLLGWNEFYRQESGTFPLSNGTITGTQYRNIYDFPIDFTAHLYGGKAGKARPYVGLGVGASYYHQLLDIGLVTFTADAWHFGLAPEVGVLLPVGRSHTLIQIAARYHYPISGGTYLDGEAHSFQYLSFNIGVMGGKW